VIVINTYRTHNKRNRLKYQKVTLMICHYRNAIYMVEFQLNSRCKMSKLNNLVAMRTLQKKTQKMHIQMRVKGQEKTWTSRWDSNYHNLYSSLSTSQVTVPKNLAGLLSYQWSIKRTSVEFINSLILKLIKKICKLKNLKGLLYSKILQNQKVKRN